MPRKPATHKPAGQHPSRDGRPSASRRGYDSDWRRFRASYLRLHPLCVECERHGVLAPATVIDHVVALERGGGKYDLGNLQALCKMHHDQKTVRCDGGLGRPKKDAR